MSLTAPTVTGWSGFWNLENGGGGYSMQSGQARAQAANVVARSMKRGSTRDARAAFAALIGAGAGGTATATFKQVSAPSGPEAAVPQATSIGDFGGNRVIDTITPINRATTAADITELKKWVSNDALLEAGITYPTVLGPNPAAGLQINDVNRF